MKPSFSLALIVLYASVTTSLAADKPNIVLIMTDDMGFSSDRGPKHPGYRGRLMERCVTIAEVLSRAGYRTIQTGKWHVGDKKDEWWPSVAALIDASALGQTMLG